MFCLESHHFVLEEILNKDSKDSFNSIEHIPNLQTVINVAQQTSRYRPCPLKEKKKNKLNSLLEWQTIISSVINKNLLCFKCEKDHIWYRKVKRDQAESLHREVIWDGTWKMSMMSATVRRSIRENEMLLKEGWPWGESTEIGKATEWGIRDSKSRADYQDD